MKSDIVYDLFLAKSGAPGKETIILYQAPVYLWIWCAGDYATTLRLSCFGPQPSCACMFAINTICITTKQCVHVPSVPPI